MARITGSIVSGNPTITITIRGSRSSITTDCIVDTGFSGFLLLPIGEAVSLGLQLDAMLEFRTVDGALHRWPTAIAIIEFGPRVESAQVTLAYDGSETLAGMEFLDFFQQSLIIHRNEVFLIDQDDLDPDLLH